MFERNIAVYVLSNPIRNMLWEKGAYTLIGLRVLQQIAVDSTPISDKIIRDQFPRTKFPIGMCIYLCFLFWRHGAKSRISADPGWQGNFYFRAAIAAVLTLVSWRFVHLDETQKIHEEKVSNAITATFNLD